MSVEAKELIAELFGYRCAYCDGPFERWDHLHPVSKGGKTTPGNMIPVCGSCNSKKRDKDPLAWLLSLPKQNLFLIEYLAAAGSLDV